MASRLEQKAMKSRIQTAVLVVCMVACRQQSNRQA
jgi:hypothetical protein